MTIKYVISNITIHWTHFTDKDAETQSGPEPPSINGELGWSLDLTACKASPPLALSVLSHNIPPFSSSWGFTVILCDSLSFLLKSCGILLRRPFVVHPFVSSPAPFLSQSLYPFPSGLLCFSLCLSASSFLPHQPIFHTVVRFTTLSTTLPHCYSSYSCSGLPTVLSVITVRLWMLTSQPCMI